MTEKQGGKRTGAGAPKKSLILKKNQICLKLPKWLIDKLSEQSESKAVQIEKALCKVNGWEAPEIDHKFKNVIQEPS